MIHILVVDDDRNLNQTVCTYLNDCGFQTKGVLSDRGDRWGEHSLWMSSGESIRERVCAQSMCM